MPRRILEYLSRLFAEVAVRGESAPAGAFVVITNNSFPFSLAFALPSPRPLHSRVTPP
jgi:hypothetical protein